MLLSVFFFSSRRRHTRCALVTGVQTCALPIFTGSSVNYIAFTGSQSVAAIVGGQVAVGMGGYSSLIAQVQAGTLRALAISSEERVPGVDIPTLKEQGIDVTLANWRGLSPTPGISDAQPKTYLDLTAKKTQSTPWKSEREGRAR